MMPLPEVDGAPSDAELVRRWLDGDELAATAIVERHAGPLARFLTSIGARGAAEDLVQDTFVRAFGSIESFRGESALRTWLFTIARRLLLDRRRAARRAGESVPVSDHDAVTDYDALDGMLADETQRRVHEALAQLTPLQRDVFLLRVNEGLSYRDIAEVAGSTEGSARVHYHNAMRTVKELLDA